MDERHFRSLVFVVDGRRRADGSRRTRHLFPSVYGTNAEAIARLAQEIAPPKVEHQVLSLARLGEFIAEQPPLRLEDITDQLIAECWAANRRFPSQSMLVELRNRAIASADNVRSEQLTGSPPISVGGVSIDPGIVGAGGETALILAKNLPPGLPPTASTLAAQAVKRLCLKTGPRAVDEIDAKGIASVWDTSKPVERRARNYVLRALAQLHLRGDSLDPTTYELILAAGYLPDEASQLGLVRFFDLPEGKRSSVKLSDFPKSTTMISELCDVFDQVQRKMSRSTQDDTLGAIRSFGRLLEETSASIPPGIAQLKADMLLDFESSCGGSQRGYHLWRNLRNLLLEAPDCGYKLDRGVENLLGALVTTLPLPEPGYRVALPAPLVHLMVIKARLELIAGLRAVLRSPASVVSNRNNSRSSEEYARALVAARILLHVATDLEPEFTKSIALENIRPEASALDPSDLPTSASDYPWSASNPKFFHLAFVKGRAHGKYRSLPLEPRSLGMWTIDAVLRITSPFRAHNQGLFIMPDGRPLNWSSGERSRTSLRRWCETYRTEWRERIDRSGLHVDVDAELDDLQWGRFRKSALARVLLRSDDSRLVARLGLGIQGEHTIQTFRRSYLPGMPGLVEKWDKEYRDAATFVEEGGTPSVKEEGSERSETAVGGCEDPSLLPSASSGGECQGDLIGLCVLCDNAVFTSEDLPQLVFLRDEVFLRQAKEAAAMELGELPSLLLKAVTVLIQRFDPGLVRAAVARVQSRGFIPPPLSPGQLQRENPERLR